jgi:hypothetical protein
MNIYTLLDCPVMVPEGAFRPASQGSGTLCSAENTRGTCLPVKRVLVKKQPTVVICWLIDCFFFLRVDSSSPSFL